MEKIIIVSKNPVKINATHEGFMKVFPDKLFELEGVSVPSGVGDQPMSDDETYEGALNRVQNASTQHADAMYWVGIEGGVQELHGNLESFAWIVVKSGDLFGKSRTGSFFLPDQVAELIKEGKELGEADDIVFKKENSKQQNGAIGILTKDVITRAEYYEQAVIMALIPFHNTSLY